MKIVCQKKKNVETFYTSNPNLKHHIPYAEFQHPKPGTLINLTPGTQAALQDSCRHKHLVSV